MILNKDVAIEDWLFIKGNDLLSKMLKTNRGQISVRKELQIRKGRKLEEGWNWKDWYKLIVCIGKYTGICVHMHALRGLGSSNATVAMGSPSA